MKISFNTSCIKPMLDWLLNYKNNNVKDETRLREILSMEDYQIEFARYGMEGLPVCGISFEEAVDFFMHFDEKEFANPRLQYKKESFIKFYNEIEERMKTIEMFTSLNENDISKITTLLVNGLPNNTLSEIEEFNIIIIVSIGNSMGWPYDHYVDYDVSNLNVFENKDDFIHVTAHEINHIFVGGLLAPEGITGEEFFLQNFAYEGLAVHFNNNQPTLYKPSKYEDRIYCMQTSDMAFYEAHFDEIFKMIQDDYQACKGKSLEEVSELVGAHYEQFTFMNQNIQQYPTYYFGCYMWGLVELKYGKEKMFEAISNPSLFVELYNEVAEEKYRFE